MTSAFRIAMIIAATAYLPICLPGETISSQAALNQPDGKSMSSQQLSAAPTALPTPLPLDGPQMWQTIQKSIAASNYADALASLEKLRQQADYYQDDDQLTRALLTMVGLHIQTMNYSKGLELLYHSTLPIDEQLRALVIMLRAYCLQYYLKENAYRLAQADPSEDKTDFRNWSSRQVINACLEDYYHAWSYRIYLGVEAFDAYTNYFNYWNFSFGASPTIRDYLTYALADFLADPTTWDAEAYDQTNRLDSASMKTDPFGYARRKGLTTDTAQHPIELIILIFQDLSLWHENSSVLSKAVRAKQRCSELVTRAFRKHHIATQSLKNIQNTFNTDPALPDELETIKNNLKKRLSW